MASRSDMPQPSFLQRRGSVFQFRRKIPRALRRHFGGRTEIKFSLGTRDPREAEREARRHAVETDRHFERLRSSGYGKTRPGRVVAAPGDESLPRLLTELWRHHCLAGDEWSRHDGLTDSEFEECRVEREATLAELQQLLARGRVDRIRPAMEVFLQLVNLDVVADDATMRSLLYGFLQAVTETTGDQVRRDRGEVVRTPSAPVGSVADAGNAPTLADCFPFWKARVTDRPRETTLAFESTLDDFVEQVGELPAAQIAVAHVNRYTEYLLRDRGLAPPTVEKRLTFLNAIYNAGRKVLQLPPVSPFSGVEVPQPRNRKPRRLPLDTADLEKIFGCPLYTQRQRPRGGAGEAAAWLPVMALFTGARLEELALLRLQDIGCQDGIWYCDITDLDDETATPDADTQRRLKNTASRRRVPIHPELLRLGLLRYVESIESTNATWLFPDMRPDCKGKRSGNWSKWWGRYRRTAIGITGRLKPFHSFRHTFRHACREAEIDEEATEALMGHESQSTGRRYGAGYSLKALDRLIRRVGYPGIVIPVLVAEDGAGDITSPPERTPGPVAHRPGSCNRDRGTDVSASLST